MERPAVHSFDCILLGWVVLFRGLTAHYSPLEHNETDTPGFVDRSNRKNSRGPAVRARRAQIGAFVGIAERLFLYSARLSETGESKVVSGGEGATGSLAKVSCRIVS